MIVRKINKEEALRTEEVFSVAFEFQSDNTLTEKEYVKDKETNPKSRGDLYLTEKFAAFDDDNKTMMGFIAATPFKAQFDGNVCKMTGIGGVSTLPQYRGHGVIRECFNESLKSAYKEDYDFSYLYPFSTAYYRQFGYETAGEVIYHYLTLDSYKRFNVGGSYYLVEQDNYETALNDVKKIYNDYKKHYNMMIEREDIDYSWLKASKPSHKNEYTYVYKNNDGEAEGVICFFKEKGEVKFDINCKHFYFSNLNGFKGLLNFALGFKAYYNGIQFMLPNDIRIESLIPEWAMYPNERKTYYNGMVRVINVENVLKKAKYKGKGVVIIKITDNQIKDNNNTFKVKFEDNQAKEVSMIDEEADIELPISDFSRFIIGTHSVEEMMYCENTTVLKNKEMLKKVFYKKKNFIVDRF